MSRGWAAVAFICYNVDWYISEERSGGLDGS